MSKREKPSRKRDAVQTGIVKGADGYPYTAAPGG